MGIRTHDAAQFRTYNSRYAASWKEKRHCERRPAENVVNSSSQMRLQDGEQVERTEHVERVDLSQTAFRIIYR